MHTLKEQIEQRIFYLKSIIKEKEAQTKNTPEGTIHISNSGRKAQYYLCKNEKRTYIKESDKGLVEKLCQKDYDQRVLKSAKQELKELEKLNKLYEGNSCEAVYTKLHAERQKQVNPIWISDDEYVKKWQNLEYKGKSFLEETPEHYTDKGERVRSKSEIMIANAMNRHNIPYRYEQPLYLKGYGTIYPDFTALNVRSRKEIYWEHMGMMDNNEYVENALRKIDTYEKNDIFPGDRLILTHETAKHPLNARIIEKVIMQYLI